MNIIKNASLTSYSTMGLGGTAAFVADVNNRAELTQALDWAKSQKLPVIMIGGGSNIVWKDEGFAGLLLINKIMGYRPQVLDETTVYLNIGAGENWDSVVERSVADGLTGIEALSLIPGSAGATPIQNVGAYGQEISQTLATIEAYDTHDEQYVTLASADCAFSYRNSRFKTKDRGRFLIVGITLQLTRGKPMPPFYGAVQTYFEENSVTDPTPESLRQAVMAIRTAKLPDPSVIRNTGSFFANPIISQDDFFAIETGGLTIPHWPTDDGKVKVSAAWLIEHAGYKDNHDSETGMSTWPKQPLVLVNESAKSTADLLAYKQKIVDAVKDKYGVTLSQEPEMLPYSG